MMPQFDLEGARRAGYSDDEILSHLTASRKFDIQGAVKSGYSKPEIIAHLAGQGGGGENSAPTTTAPPTPVPAAPGVGDPATQNTQGDPITRGISSWWDEVNPVQQVKGMAGAVMHPLDTLKGMGEAQDSLRVKAGEAFGRGDIMDGIKYTLAYATPLFGPAAAKASEQIDAGDVAGGIGKTAGIATNALLPVAASKVRSIPLTPGLRNRNPTVAAAVDAQQAAGVPVPASVATGNTFVRMAQRAAETTPAGSIVGDTARQGLSEAMATRGRNLAAQVNPTMAVPETAATATRTGIESTISRLKGEADTAYGEFRSAAKDPANAVRVQTGTKTVNTGVLDASGNPITRAVPITEKIAIPVDVRALKSELKPLYDEMQKWMEPAKRDASAGLQAIKSIIEGPDYLPATVAEKGLGGLKSLTREAASSDLRNTSQGIAANVVGKLQQSIEDAAAKAGPQVLEQLKRGRAAHAEKMEAADVLGKMRDEPVQAFNQATYANDAGIDQLRAVSKLAPGEMAKLGRAYVEKLVDKATAEGGFGRGAGLWSDWQKLGPETKKILFQNPGLRQDLDKFFLVAKKVSDEINPSMTAIVGHGLGSAALIFTNPVTGAAYQLGSAALTKMLYSPAGVRALTKGLRIPVSNKAAAAVAAQQILKASRGAAELVTPTQADMPGRSPLPAQ